MAQAGKPPFRADHVGSLLRPKALLDARDKHAKGEIAAEQLRKIEDEAIRDAVKLQEDAGLQGVTDGEYRRTYFHIDFLEQLEGVSVTGGIAMRFRGAKQDVDFAPPKLEVKGKLKRTGPIQAKDFDYLKSVTKRTPKVCIPSPTMLHFRGGRKGVDAKSYPDMDGFFADLARVFREEIADLAELGCTYIQLDDTNLAYLCDPKLQEATRQLGEDPEKLPYTYAKIINDSIAGRPKEMTVCIHLCRGNFRSAWVAEGGYDPVAEALFNELAVDGYFLEYDDARSGSFAPLRFVPKGKTVVLGLVSSKVPVLETVDELRHRIDEAAQYVPLGQLALSPQCGFSSTVHGNDITVADEIAKLRRVVETAEKVWG